MHFQFLIEDMSSEALINILMPKLINQDGTDSYKCKSFKGIGGFTSKKSNKGEKKGALLPDLAQYLRGFDKSLQNISATLIIVLDNDSNDTKLFREKLENIAKSNNISTDYVFCIAVEEMEAWLLGDENALITAYPNAKLASLKTYVQDSICGTWEKLADVVYPGGLAKFSRDCPTYVERGYYKSIWAKNIGQYMNVSSNKSPSFKFFISEITKRIEV